MESTMARIVCCVTWPDNVYRTPSATNTAAHSGFRSLPAVPGAVSTSRFTVWPPAEVNVSASA